MLNEADVEFTTNMVIRDAQGVQMVTLTDHQGVDVSLSQFAAQLRRNSAGGGHGDLLADRLGRGRARHVTCLAFVRVPSLGQVWRQIFTGNEPFHACGQLRRAGLHLTTSNEQQ